MGAGAFSWLLRCVAGYQAAHRSAPTGHCGEVCESRIGRGSGR